MAGSAAPSGDPQHEVYTHGYSPQVEAYMAARTARRQAGFFLPHLRPGMRLLDCGCGPGSLTLDLAAAVAPGPATGIDLAPSQVAAARARAAARAATTVHFLAGDIYELPFPDGSFDAVFAHTVLQHLRDPGRALREMRRVLAPGGVIGVRDDDYGAFLLEPAGPLLGLWRDLLIRAWAHNGGDPYLGRAHRAALKAAGFVRTQGSSSTDAYGSLEATAAIAAAFREHHQQPAFVRVVLEQGWADRATLAAMDEAVGAWGARDDAFASLTFCEAVGWNPELGR